MVLEAIDWICREGLGTCLFLLRRETVINQGYVLREINLSIARKQAVVFLVKTDDE